jgi:hypothetical protein
MANRSPPPSVRTIGEETRRLASIEAQLKDEIVVLK